MMFFLICFSAHAQEGRQYSFKHFSVTNGLASNTVGAVIQDKEGFMWMATDNGLQRYDGSSFITFRHEKDVATSIPSNYIHNMYMDEEKNIWLLCEGNKL